MEFGRLLDRKVGRLSTAENLIHELGGAPGLVSEARSIGHQPSRYHVMPKNGDGRQLRVERQRIDASLVGDQERVAANVQCFHSALERLDSRRADANTIGITDVA